MVSLGLLLREPVVSSSTASSKLAISSITISHGFLGTRIRRVQHFRPIWTPSNRNRRNAQTNSNCTRISDDAVDQIVTQGNRGHIGLWTLQRRYQRNKREGRKILYPS